MDSEGQSISEKDYLEKALKPQPGQEAGQAAPRAAPAFETKKPDPSTPRRLKSLPQEALKDQSL